MKRLIVIMGVSGSGKSHIGRSLSKKMGVPFLEGDDFHPKANVSKMAGGTPLTNQDREAWIEAMAEAIRGHAENTLVLSCSALNDFVRSRLKNGCGRHIDWIHLDISRDELLRRLQKRKNHFMKADLLDSQLEAMHPPKEAYRVNESLKPFEMVHSIREYLDSVKP